jgi:hypothetical protein
MLAVTFVESHDSQPLQALGSVMEGKVATGKRKGLFINLPGWPEYGLASAFGGLHTPTPTLLRPRGVGIQSSHGCLPAREMFESGVD